MNMKAARGRTGTCLELSLSLSEQGYIYTMLYTQTSMSRQIAALFSWVNTKLWLV